VGIYILSLVAGIELWRDTSFGRKASILVQVIQIPKIISPIIIFLFSCGFDFWIHLLFTGGYSTFGFQFQFLTFNQFLFNVPDAPIGLGLSLTGLVFLAILWNHKPGRVEPILSPSEPPPPVSWDEFQASVTEPTALAEEASHESLNESITAVADGDQEDRDGEIPLGHSDFAGGTTEPDPSSGPSATGTPHGDIPK
jgi:hypothetical protein